MNRKIRIDDPHGHLAEYLDLEWEEGAMLMMELEGPKEEIERIEREFQLVAAGIWKKVSLN